MAFVYESGNYVRNLADMIIDKRYKQLYFRIRKQQSFQHFMTKYSVGALILLE